MRRLALRPDHPRLPSLTEGQRAGRCSGQTGGKGEGKYAPIRSLLSRMRLAWIGFQISRRHVDTMWPVLGQPATSGPDETTHHPDWTRKAAQLRAHSLQSRLTCRLRLSRQGFARARARKEDSDAVGERQGDGTPRFPDLHFEE